MVITPEKLVKILDQYQSGLVILALCEAELNFCKPSDAAAALKRRNDIKLYMARFYSYINEAARQGVKVDHDDIERYLRNK